LELTKSGRYNIKMKRLKELQKAGRDS